MPPDSLRQQGESLYTAGRYQEAEVLFRASLEEAPHDAAAHYNLGVVLARQDRYHEAIVCFAAALKHNPNLSLAYSNAGFCLHELGEIRMARQAFSLAQQLAPEDPLSRLNEGLADLTLGEFSDGWLKFEARWERAETKSRQRKFTQPLWRGESLQGKTLLLHAEEGFGDSLQMIRYTSLLQKRGAKLVLEVQPALTHLFHASLPADIRILNDGDALPDFDFHVPMLSTPIGFNTQLDTIPADTPYLRAPAEDRARWANSMPSRKRSRIGLVWAGRPSHERDRFRSLLLTQLSPLFALTDILWVNLQQPLSTEDEAFFLSHYGFVGTPSAFRDFADTAGLIDNLDLVITIDTSIAHLSGALAKPTWLLLPHVADWRWLLGRTDSPWYPTMRLYRQPKAGDWTSVITCVKQDLEKDYLG